MLHNEMGLPKKMENDDLNGGPRYGPWLMPRRDVIMTVRDITISSYFSEPLMTPPLPYVGNIGNYTKRYKKNTEYTNESTLCTPQTRFKNNIEVQKVRYFY